MFIVLKVERINVEWGNVLNMIFTCYYCLPKSLLYAKGIFKNMIISYSPRHSLDNNFSKIE